MRKHADTPDLHDVFTAEAPLTVSSPAEAMGEWGADAAVRQIGLGDWSPSPSRASTIDGSTSSAAGSRRASVDGALAAPFTTPQASKLARGHALSVWSLPADRRASIATTPKSGPSPVAPSSAAPVGSLSEPPPPVLASFGMSLAPIATNATPPRTPLVRTRRPPPRAEMPDLPTAAAPHAKSASDAVPPPPTGVSERTLKSHSSADTNPDWLFDRVDGSASSHVSTPSLDVADGSVTPGAPTSCLAAPPKPTVRTQSPLALSPSGLPCRDLQQSWAHTPDTEPVLRAMHSEWDLYSYASSDSALSTPVRIRAPPPAPAPLAVRLVQTGTGHLSVVRPEHAHDDEVRAEVRAETTHLSMKGCALPLPVYDVLRVPASLVVLDLSHAALDRLPPALAHCGALEELNVSHNPLHDLAHWAPLGALRRLRVLLADACALCALPAELVETRELEVLALRSNALTHLPSWLWVLERLACVLLEGNDAIAPAWKPVLAPLLAPDAVPEVSSDALHAVATPASLASEAPSPAAGDAKRGLLHKALRWGAPRRAERDTHAATRTPSYSSVRDTDTLRSATPTDSLRASPKSLVAAMPHAGDATRAPLPPLGAAGAAGSDTGADVDVVPCFLPVYAAAPGEASRAVRRSAYVRDLLHYLVDLDDLRPERHVALPVTTAVRLGVPLSPGPPSTPGTPLLPSVASFATADATPSTTVSPLTPRDMSPDAGPGILEAERVKEDASKRQRLINEIVETERTYVANLLELMDIYVKRARQPLDGHPEERVLPVAKERAVFGHIEGIVHFHAHAFLPALEHAAAPALGAPADAPCTAATAARVAHVFTQHAAYFKMYMNYVNQYDSAVRHIARWSQPVPARARSGPKAAIENAGMTLATLGQRLALHASPEADAATRHAADDWDTLPNARRRQIQAYLVQCREDPRHSQLNLEGYLLLPIQRIPRYRMLLEQLVRCTAAELLPREETDAIPRALAHIALVASWVNEGKRQSEQGRRLLLWQSKLRGNFSAPLVQPHRRLVCDGPLRFRRVSRRADAPADAPADAHVLEQTVLDQRVQLLLCNDLAAVVAIPRDAHTNDARPEAHAPAPPIEPADVDAVDLLAVMKPCVRTGGSPGALVPPASVVDEALLRVVDARYVFYFVANSHRDAVQWARAINAQPGG
ncbi:hypothetical protein MBRA1_000308 [Malassezia brasiliensis]|uniref:DH domain-containing protein n=1 Tax=Malassezia brasiliensis TaxID=1821822 RepID=A0AAF0DRZ8_9BASI|nr:hypothetical protein MBRA1_000308 [Malassezia brasiliensis]